MTIDYNMYISGIIQKGHKVGGVRVQKGSETHEIFAPMIISRNQIINIFC